ncbi:chemotaxis protein CheA [Desulfobulbus rhabdoformis]|uniref:chemotaxis protein CheA n=1 Tax=Desulfobulbus rhabdoformis TaxID=34032 RepID=UPI00196281C1|nr:chemotaxis protein CheA [Desulfobulbus rhabdoformis]MBM9614922.1 chemotaxis protein CheA [Desulfobulbus rhabdoformis]
MSDQHIEVFREEAAELLASLETALLELEESPQDQELVAQVFRAMHTIKGSGAMFGFDEVAEFTHEVETVFDLVRKGELPVTGNLVSQSLSARDYIRSLLEEDTEGEVDRAQGQRLMEIFRSMAQESSPKAAEQHDETPDPLEPSADAEQDLAGEATYRIRLRLAEDISLSGTRPEGLLRELSELGPCKVVAQPELIPLLDTLVPELCYVHWDIILNTSRGINAIKDVFIFVEDDAEINIDVIDDNDSVDSDPSYKRIGEILVERGDISQEELDSILAPAKPIGQKLVDMHKVTTGSVQAALHEQEMVREVRSQRKTKESTSSVRVPADRLDELVNRVGELVTVQARLSQAANMRNDNELLAIAEEVERLTAELRDTSLNMRMLPIGTTFSKFKRLVRDLSNELNKKVDLKTTGAETEIDKTVIEKLNDPLVHLIRNSLDHGIESPETRQAANKPATGTVLLAAAHSGDSVELIIKDDGKGLDRDAIFTKGVERGLITPDAQLSDTEVFNLIFAPGFSTAQQVTGISGRGVGMDVVKRAIDNLRGNICIDSQPGEGSTITIRIPLTLAIVESLLVSVDEDNYALPLSIVEECVELSQEDIARAHGRNLINVREQIVPYIPLREEFDVPSEPPPLQQVVITSVNGTQVGLVVDQVIGQHQSVIKSLGRVYRDVQGISGATILGDGSVALILDINHLAYRAEQAG